MIVAPLMVDIVIIIVRIEFTVVKTGMLKILDAFWNIIC